jgi:hypothetical protein
MLTPEFLALFRKLCAAVGTLTYPGVKSEAANVAALQTFDELLRLDESGKLDFPPEFLPFAQVLAALAEDPGCQAHAAELRSLAERATLALQEG